MCSKKSNILLCQTQALLVSADCWKLLFKYMYASLHSWGLIVLQSGKMRSHSALNSGSKKSSGKVRIPDWVAASLSCASVTGKPVK